MVYGKSLSKAILNTLNAELNRICHLLALLGVQHILHVSRIRVKTQTEILSIMCNNDKANKNVPETYSRVRVGENLSDRFPIRNGLKQGDALLPLLFNFDLEYAIRRV